MLNTFKFANLDGIITSECFNCDIEKWGITIHTLLPESSPSKKEKGHEFCTILIFHQPPKSEVLVSQDIENKDKPMVSENDQIRYVSVKLPFEIQIFKGELKNCSEYQTVENLEELISKLNENLSENEQKDFLMQSYSNILLRTYDLPFNMEEYLKITFNNLDIIEPFKFIDVNQFSKEQAELIFKKIVGKLDVIVNKHISIILEELKPFYEDNEQKLTEIQSTMKQKINLLESGFINNLVKADGNQIIKRFLRTSKEVIDTFFNSRIFTKKRMFLVDNMLFKSPLSYFEDQTQVNINEFVKPYVSIIKDHFDEQINLNMSIHPKFKREINSYISDIITILNGEMVSSKMDMMEISRIENGVNKDIGNFVNEDLSFNDVFADVIYNIIYNRTVEYLKKWGSSELVTKLQIVNTSNEVNLANMEIIYKMYGNKPFSNLPSKNHFIKLLSLEEGLNYI
jgi:hypothetical protein